MSKEKISWACATVNSYENGTFEAKLDLDLTRKVFASNCNVDDYGHMSLPFYYDINEDLDDFVKQFAELCCGRGTCIEDALKDLQLDIEELNDWINTICN